MSEGEAAQGRQYLTLLLGEELFALEVCRIREVLDSTPITEVPGSPDYMLGLINVRGSVIPILDLGLRIGMGRREPRIHSCIILLDVVIENEENVIGLLVDSVREVVPLPADRIDPTPLFGIPWDSRLLSGVGRYNDEFLLLLDIDKIVSPEEFFSNTDVEEGHGP